MAPEQVQLALGARLQGLREQSSLRKLASQTQLSKQTLISAERGADMQLSTLLKLLQAHGYMQVFLDLVEALPAPQPQAAAIESGRQPS